MINLKFLLATLFVAQTSAQCFATPYFSVQGGGDVTFNSAVVDVSVQGDVAVAGYAVNKTDPSKSSAFINLREGVSCLMAWQRTFASTTPLEFRAVKIELNPASTTNYQWLKVHAALF
jgi:hypothetical protein